MNYEKNVKEFCEEAEFARPAAGGKEAVTPPKHPQEGEHYLHPFEEALYILVLELECMSHNAVFDEPLDRSVQGLRMIHLRGNIPARMVVACQVHMDIHDVLGGHCFHGLEAMKTCKRMSSK